MSYSNQKRQLRVTILSLALINGLPGIAAPYGFNNYSTNNFASSPKLNAAATSPSLSPSYTSNLSPIQSSTIQTGAISPISTATISPISTTAISPISTATISPISAATISPISTATISPISTATISPVSTATISPISTATFTPVSTATFTPVSNSSLGNVSTIKTGIISTSPSVKSTNFSNISNTPSGFGAPGSRSTNSNGYNFGERNSGISIKGNGAQDRSGGFSSNGNGRGGVLGNGHGLPGRGNGGGHGIHGNANGQGNGEEHGNGGGLVDDLEGCVEGAAHGASDAVHGATGNGHGQGQGQDPGAPLPAPGIPGIPGLPPGNNIVGTVVSIQASQMQLTLFSTGNQVMQGARGQVFGGTPGTMLSQQKDMVILHRGKLTVDSGKEGAIIQTKAGPVSLKPETTAIIDDESGKSVKISAISGKAEAISVRGAATNNNVVTANVGQCLILSESGIEEEELIAADGNEAAIIGGAIEKRPTAARKNIDIAELTRQAASSRAGRNTRLSSNIAQPNSKKNSQSFSGDIWDLFDAKNSNKQPSQVVAQPGTKFVHEENGNIHLLYGSIFVSTKSGILVKTESAQIQTRQNSLTMVETTGELCRVKALSGPGDLKVASAGAELELAPGQEMVISKRVLSKIELNPADAIARRNRSSNQQLGDLQHSINEFSMTSMLHYPGYRQMISALDQSGKLEERILKTAVVVEMVTRARGKYAYSDLYNEQKVASDAKDKLSSAKIN